MNWIDEANKKLEEQRANYQESLENGEVTSRKKTYVSEQRNKGVTKETRSKAGKIGGNETSKLFTRESQIKAVKSRTSEGIMKSVKAAGVASGEIKKQKQEIYKKKLYNIITLDEFTIKDVEHLYMEFDHLNDSQMIRKWINDTKYFIPIGRKGKARIFKKI